MTTGNAAEARALFEELTVLRQREVQMMGAAISLRNWHDMETAYNTARDRLDRTLIAMKRAFAATEAASQPREGEVEPFLTQLRRVNTTRYHAWVGEGQDAGILFDAAELGGEVGELLNVVKKLEREERGWRGSRAAPEDFPDECADVLICLDKLARRRGVDLEAATITKFNATSDKVGLPHKLAALPPATKPASEGVAVPAGMTDEERRLEDLKQMAAYAGPVVSFEVTEAYYLASCDHCGWVGSSELCGADSYGDDSDVYCPRCQASGADCGKVAGRIEVPTPASEATPPQDVREAMAIPAAVEALIQWARDEQAFPRGNPGGSGRGHIDENARFELRDLVDAIDALTSPSEITPDKGMVGRSVKVRRNPDDAEWTYCPLCKTGMLDTGFECNSCGFDAQPLVHLQESCEATGDRMHPSGLYQREIENPILATPPADADREKG